MSTSMISIDNFTKEFVESLDPKVKQVDKIDNIELYCYTTCSDDDDEQVKACRGIVFNGDDLVLKAFSYTPEYTCDQFTQLDDTYHDTSKYTFFESYEGALIRVFHIDDKWFISTHRRLDAFKSKWASRTSFGTFFSMALEYEFSTSPAFKDFVLSSEIDESESILYKFISKLNKEHQYMFILQNNNENRIVCTPPQYPRVIHVGTFTKPNGEPSHPVDDNVHLMTPKKYTFSTLEDAFEYVEQMDYTKLQGLVMFTGPVDQIKLVNRTYKYLSELRYNEPSIKNRYLQLRMDTNKRKDFEELYPEYQSQFDQYENIIYNIADTIFHAYLTRFIHKQYKKMPPDEYSIMKECHAWHVEDRKNHHISLDKVIQVLNEQPVPKLNRMIRKYITDQRKREQAEHEDEIERTTGHKVSEE